MVAGYQQGLASGAGYPVGHRRVGDLLERTAGGALRDDAAGGLDRHGRRCAPSRSPRARLAGRAFRVRWLIRRRSYGEPEMMILAAISPAGVLVSMARSAKCSAHPRHGTHLKRPTGWVLEVDSGDAAGAQGPDGHPLKVDGGHVLVVAEHRLAIGQRVVDAAHRRCGFIDVGAAFGAGWPVVAG
jgi:hypothetical protein